MFCLQAYLDLETLSSLLRQGGFFFVSPQGLKGFRNDFLPGEGKRGSPVLEEFGGQPRQR
ncbi:hypothetical protein ACP3TJ_10395 [Desulforudis sp. 1088]|uniref:hypothetical protein n=1 Tax=unclassified Candidatus Desulforudis TaxID=2635950 RepID=UPI003CE483E8